MTYLTWAIVVLYGLAMLFHIRILFSARHPLRVAGLLVLSAAVLANLFYITISIAKKLDNPMLSHREILFTFTLIAALAFLLFEYSGGEARISSVGSFLLPLVFVFSVAGAITSVAPVEPHVPIHPLLFPIHVSTAMAGEVVFCISFILGLMYLIERHYLKSKTISSFIYRLPSLEMLDNSNARAIQIGFLLLTIGMVAGTMWYHSAFKEFWLWEPKTISALAIWVYYGVGLLLRALFGWRGKRMGMFTVVGFIAVLFTFIGVNLLFKGIHGF